MGESEKINPKLPKKPKTINKIYSAIRTSHMLVRQSSAMLGSEGRH